MEIVIALLAWLLLSPLVALVVGRCIRFGTGDAGADAAARGQSDVREAA